VRAENGPRLPCELAQRRDEGKRPRLVAQRGQPPQFRTDEEGVYAAGRRG
jgi:hypothetical protein